MSAAPKHDLAATQPGLRRAWQICQQAMIAFESADELQAASAVDLVATLIEREIAGGASTLLMAQIERRKRLAGRVS